MNESDHVKHIEAPSIAVADPPGRLVICRLERARIRAVTVYVMSTWCHVQFIEFTVALEKAWKCIISCLRSLGWSYWENIHIYTHRSLFLFSHFWKLKLQKRLSNFSSVHIWLSPQSILFSLSCSTKCGDTFSLGMCGEDTLEWPLMTHTLAQSLPFERRWDLCLASHQ